MFGSFVHVSELPWIINLLLFEISLSLPYPLQKKLVQAEIVRERILLIYMYDVK